jgi:hypothetical protein
MKTFIFIIGILVLIRWIAKLLTKGYEILITVHNETRTDLILSKHAFLERSDDGTVRIDESQIRLLSGVSREFKDATSHPDIEAIIRYNIFDTEGRDLGSVSGYHSGGKAYGASAQCDPELFKITEKLIYANEIRASYEISIGRK